MQGWADNLFFFFFFFLPVRLQHLKKVQSCHMKPIKPEHFLPSMERLPPLTTCRPIRSSSVVSTKVTLSLSTFSFTADAVSLFFFFLNFLNTSDRYFLLMKYLCNAVL